MSNPFRAAEAVAPRVKCLIYGPSGVGKTYLSLTAPGPIAVIDTEGGTAFYANRAGLSAFDVLPTKTFHDVTQAIAYLKANPRDYETLVIDPITVLYETLQDAAQFSRATKRNNPDADLEMLDWQRIKRAYKTLMTDLVNLPMHVLVTARERDDSEKRGTEMVKIGVRPDAEKSTPYYFDAIVRLTASGAKRAAVVEKDRTGTLSATVNAPSFGTLFGKAIEAGKGATGERNLQDDGEAAQTDADSTFAEGQNERLPSSPDGGLVGKVGTKGSQDFELRQTPDGPMLPFRVTSGRAGMIVVATGQLAEALSAIRETIIGQRVTVYGQIADESYVKADGSKVTYQQLHLERISTPDGILPAPSVAPAASDGPVEAPSVEAWDLAALDAELAR